MKRVLAVFGVAAACAACCAIPLALPLLAGLTVSGMGLAALGWQAGVALLVATGAFGLTIVVRNRKKVQASAAAPSPGGTCGCPPPSCAGRD